MIAAEIIEMIEKLPAAEREQVRKYIAQKAKAAEPSDGVRRTDYEKAMAVGEKIFDRHAELFRKLAQ